MTNTHMSPSRAGDFAEYYAVTWLWDQGYQVFKNCGCDGPVDLIAVADDGSIILIDVKTYRQAGSENCFRKTGERTPKQIEMGVQVLGFDPRDRKCYFVEHRDETTYTRHRNEQSTQYDLAYSDSGC
jgi:Holliday junction resolvase-like predicted endonuclease